MIIISSIGALRGSQVLGLYGTSKAAEAGLARALAVQWGPQNIRVNTIAPGLVKTDFAKALCVRPKRSSTQNSANFCFRTTTSGRRLIPGQHCSIFARAPTKPPP